MSDKQVIYLDNAATTRIAPEVLDAMRPYLTEKYGNPGSIHSLGREAAQAVAEARHKVAGLINAEDDQIIFTSGGSEANNLVLKGCLNYLESIGKTTILVSSVEHDSVLNAARDILSIKPEFHVRKIPVTSECVLDMVELESMLTQDVGLVSTMYVNNEIGSVNPVKDICSMVHKSGALFHTDCVQAAGSIEIDVKDIGCDFASISSHKIHGPKGVGALFVNNKRYLSPIISGGANQEYGVRGGTENVASIVGFGEACYISKIAICESQFDASVLKKIFYKRLVNRLEEYKLNDIIELNGKDSLLSNSKVINIKIDGIDSETSVLMMDLAGVLISSGSACTSHESAPSHVLTSMGMSPKEARECIRISISRYSTSEEMNYSAEVLSKLIITMKLS